MFQKKNGFSHFYVDCRKLNAVTNRDSYHILRMDECIDSFVEAEMSSSVDCPCGYSK